MSSAGCVLFGFGLENLILGRIVLFSSDKTALIRPVKPEAPSEWPTLGFDLIRR
jgi:hypothetical protein